MEATSGFTEEQVLLAFCAGLVVGILLIHCGGTGRREAGGGSPDVVGAAQAVVTEAVAAYAPGKGKRARPAGAELPVGNTVLR